MRILLNIAPASGRRTGIGHYTHELHRCMRRGLGPNDELAVFPSFCFRALHTLRGYWHHGHAHGHALYHRGRALVRALVPRALRPVRKKSAPPPPQTSAAPPGDVKRRLFDRLLQWEMDRHYASGAFDVYHEPNYIPVPSTVPTIVTLADLSMVTHPEWHPADRVAWFERGFPRALAQCVHFLAISDFCRQEIIQTLGVPAEKVTRTYMGIRPGFRPLPEHETQRRLRQLGFPQRYLLYVGTIEPRKNLLVLIKAYCQLPAPLRERFPLILVGNWGWNYEEVGTYYHDFARHQGVRQCGYVPERHLPAVYNGARALVYPPLYEGFGLPPVEMMACGGAVLASTADAVAEVVGPHGHLLEPRDIDAWRDAMHRVLTDDDWAESLRQGVVAAAGRYTWEACAADTLKAYRVALGRSSPARKAA